MGQSEAAIRGLEETGATIRAGVGSVAYGPDEAAKKILEQDTGCYGTLAHPGGFHMGARMLCNTFMPDGGFSVVSFGE